MAAGNELLLTEDQHSELRAIAQTRSLPAGCVFRATLILLLAEGAALQRSTVVLPQLTVPNLSRRIQFP
jgi:hypothetical protein